MSRGVEAERDRAGDQRAGRGAADEVEPVGEQERRGELRLGGREVLVGDAGALLGGDVVGQQLALVLGEDRLDALQERDRDRAAHAAAVERQDPLRTRSEQVAVAAILGLEEIFNARRIGQFGHTDNPSHRRFLPAALRPRP